MNDTRWAVISTETRISVSYHDKKEDAECVAREMTEYHGRPYVVARVSDLLSGVDGGELPPS